MQTSNEQKRRTGRERVKKKFFFEQTRVKSKQKKGDFGKKGAESKLSQQFSLNIYPVSEESQPFF